MYAAKMQFHLSCPKHKRFSPAIQGEKAIKGGCLTCTAMCFVYDRYNNLVAALRKADYDGAVAPKLNTTTTKGIKP